MISAHILGLYFLNLKKTQVTCKYCSKGLPKTLRRMFVFVADGSTVIADS